jgi:hypothetical protein
VEQPREKKVRRSGRFPRRCGALISPCIGLGLRFFVNASIEELKNRACCFKGLVDRPGRAVSEERIWNHIEASDVYVI